jgi:hypothetical protein
VSPLPLGGPFGFVVVGTRRCLGAQGLPCPRRADLPGDSTRALCADCTAFDRRHSVAADTAMDDPRPFRLYLAWFGPGLLKLGITAAERGDARLLEQGALAFTWLGEGPLAATRRAESALGAAHGIPDRMRIGAKRAARTSAAGVPAVEAAGQLLAAADALQTSSAWPDTLATLSPAVVDQRRVFRLPAAGPAPEVAVTSLRPGATAVGRLVAVVGSDAYVDLDLGRRALLPLPLLAGWSLTRPAGPTTAPLADLPAPADPGLF